MNSPTYFGNQRIQKYTVISKITSSVSSVSSEDEHCVSTNHMYMGTLWHHPVWLGEGAAWRIRPVSLGLGVGELLACLLRLDGDLGYEVAVVEVVARRRRLLFHAPLLRPISARIKELIWAAAIYFMYTGCLFRS